MYTSSRAEDPHEGQDFSEGLSESPQTQVSGLCGIATPLLPIEDSHPISVGPKLVRGASAGKSPHLIF